MIKVVNLKRISVIDSDLLKEGRIVTGGSDAAKMRRSIRRKVEENETRRRAEMEIIGKSIVK